MKFFAGSQMMMRNLCIDLFLGVFLCALVGCGGADESKEQIEEINAQPRGEDISDTADGGAAADAPEVADASEPDDVQLDEDITQSKQDTGDGAPDTGNTSPAPPNILLIIADDLGVGASRCYDVGTDLAPTPNIEALCERGVVFDNMWSAPTCSPTRASLMTGRYAYRTGVGNVIASGNPGLSLDEWSIPRVLDANPGLGYRHACIGKWHVGPTTDKNHPNDMGFGYFSGLLVGGVQSYTDWRETTDGKTESNTQYATTRHVDQALAWLGAQESPWFLWLALVSPHTPLHLPPANLHSYSGLSGTEEDMEANGGTYFRAMIEAMDREIGRLLEGIGEEQLENTLVIYVGDNGTTNSVIEAPYQSNRAKGTLYQGGVHVPLVIAGPGVSGTPRRSPALAHMVDLFATILDAAGVSSMTIPADVPIDGASLGPVLDGSKVSVHEHVMTEIFGGSQINKLGKAIRDTRYKLIQLESGNQRFFDLEADPYEQSPLGQNNLEPDVLLRYENLKSILEALPTD